MNKQPSSSETVYLKEQITRALADGRTAKIPSLAHDLALAAAADIENFTQSLDMLAYHGQAAVAAAMMQQAWPLLKESSDVMGQGIDDFAARATDMIIFYRLEENAAAGIDLLTLQRELEPFFAIDREGLARYLAYLAGRQSRQWTSDDFDFQQQKQEASQNLSTLLIEFLAYLYYQESVPYSKGDLARRQIPDYLVRRRTGQLEPRPDMAAVLRGQRPLPKPRPPAHPLCPDRPTLTQYLARLLHFARPQPYRAAATFELMPGWLRFLESRDLIDPAQRQETLHDLWAMVADLIQLWQEYPEDPALLAAMQQWPDQAGLETE